MISLKAYSGKGVVKVIKTMGTIKVTITFRAQIQ